MFMRGKEKPCKSDQSIIRDISIRSSPKHFSFLRTGFLLWGEGAGGPPQSDFFLPPKIFNKNNRKNNRNNSLLF